MMVDTLKKISDLIDTYDSGAWVSVDNLRVMLRELSTNCYRLTKFNIEAGVEHNRIQYNFKGSVAAGKILAEEKVPELRKTRKLIFQANKVLDSMRSEIGILRTER